MGISVWQIALVVLVVVVLFGAGRLPRLMGDMAKGIKSFKQGMKEELDDSPDTVTPGKLESEARVESAEEKDRARNS